MRTILAADDLTPNMFVAVYSQHSSESTVQRRGPNDFVVHEGAEAPVPPGVPLKVLSISLPFVVCSVLSPGGTYSGPVIVDVRTTCLCRINEKFVLAIASFGDDSEKNDEVNHNPEIDETVQNILLKGSEK